MKYLNKLLIISLLGLASCNTTNPFIVPNNTKDNVVLMALKDEIAQEGSPKTSYGWLFWYLPVVILASFWGYREFVRRPILCEEDGQMKDESSKDKETKNTPSSGV